MTGTIEVSREPGYFDGFEWDQAKSEASLAQRGLDFETASQVFEGAYLEREDRRRDYGETRWVVTGAAAGAVVTVVWTARGRSRRIISAWPASNRERRQYRDYHQAHE